MCHVPGTRYTLYVSASGVHEAMIGVRRTEGREPRDLLRPETDVFSYDSLLILPGGEFSGQEEKWITIECRRSRIDLKTSSKYRRCLPSSYKKSSSLHPLAAIIEDSFGPRPLLIDAFIS